MTGVTLNGTRVLVTGATGFVGRGVVAELATAGATVRAAVRSPHTLPAAVEAVAVGDIGPDTDWSEALSGADIVIHLAAHVHQMGGGNPADFYRVNTLGTIALARAAAAAGVQRLVFLSSIKVNGEHTEEQPFRGEDRPDPQDPYARSKLEAEQGLWAVRGSSSMEATVLRPPLVYGPGVGANFAALQRALWRGLPLPLGAVANRRSLIFVRNLASAIVAAARHPLADGRTFLVSDGGAVSTPQLLRSLATGMGRPARLIPVPKMLLRAAGVLLGRGEQMSRLLSSLEVDSAPIRETIGWSPPFTFEEGLRITGEAFISARSR